LSDSVLFDTDCLSAFLWVSAEHILSSLYSGSIIVPQQVYDELSNPYTPQLKTRFDTLIVNGDAVVQSILSDAAEFKHYLKLTSAPDEGHIIIG
jgi:predicted nucleic acid-binding protein